MILNVGHAHMEGVLGTPLALEVVFLLKGVISLSLAAAVSSVTQLMYTAVYCQIMYQSCTNCMVNNMTKDTLSFRGDYTLVGLFVVLQLSASHSQLCRSIHMYFWSQNYLYKPKDNLWMVNPVSVLLLKWYEERREWVLWREFSNIIPLKLH